MAWKRVRAATRRDCARRPHRLRRGTNRILEKLSDAIAADVDLAVMAIAANPAIGTRKKGDLADLYVYKFRSQGQLVLLGYSVDHATRAVYLEAVGAHENFYRNLKRAR